MSIGQDNDEIVHGEEERARYFLDKNSLDGFMIFVFFGISVDIMVRYYCWNY